jgi:flagella basal body P-ring formation protein FlgA
MQGGRLGDVIRVVNPDTGRRLPARIVGPGAVEVRHGT